MDADREHLWNLFKRLKENKNKYIMVYNISDDIINILIKKLKKISLKKRQDTFSFEKIYLLLYARPLDASSSLYLPLLLLTPFFNFCMQTLQIFACSQSLQQTKNIISSWSIFSLWKLFQIRIEKIIQPKRDKKN